MKLKYTYNVWLPSKLKLFLFFIFYFLFFANVFSQPKDPEIESGIKYIYHIKFDSADIKFNSYLLKHPNKPEGYFFLAMLEWWKILLNKQDESFDEEFYSRIKKVIDVSDKILEKNENDFDALFYKGGALGYRGLLRSVRESWLKAAEDGKEALNLFHQAVELKPDNKEALFGIGIYNYFADYVPEKFPILKPLMIIFPKGDKVKGLMQIKEIALGNSYAGVEANYTLAYLYINYEKNYIESEFYSRKLFEQFPENPVFDKFLFSSLVGISKFDEAITGFKNIIQKYNDKLPGYDNKYTLREANYYTVLSLVRLGRTIESEPYLKECMELMKEIDKEDTSFGVFTYLLYGMYFDVIDNHPEAVKYYDKVLSMTNFSNSKEQAETYKKNGYR